SRSRSHSSDRPTSSATALRDRPRLSRCHFTRSPVVSGSALRFSDDGIEHHPGRDQRKVVPMLRCATAAPEPSCPDFFRPCGWKDAALPIKPVLYAIGCGGYPSESMPDLVVHAKGEGWDVC